MKPQLVIYGGRVTLTGTLSNQKVGENVDVLAKPCGQTAATKLTTVQTTTGGAFTAVVRPLKNTPIRSRSRVRRVNDGLRQGAPEAVSSQAGSSPLLAARIRWQSFAGKYGTFQRYNGTLAALDTVKRVLLRANRRASPRR